MLRTDEEIQLPRFTGYISRGILLNLIRNADPSSSQTLHESNVVKPYSVTPLFFRSRRKTDIGYIVDPSSPCSFRLRFLKEKHGAEILRNFENKHSLMLRDKTLRIESVKVNTKTYEEIIKSAFPVKKVYFEFLTPTRFSALGRDHEYLFPDQKKIFGGLLKIWNCFSGSPISPNEVKEYLNWLGRESWVTHYSLQTEIRNTTKGNIIGFTGRITFAFGKHEKWQKITACLAWLAPFSNIGKGRTAGFGVVHTQTYA